MATKQELEAGGRQWLAGRWAQVPMAGKQSGWTDTRRWVELFVPEFADGQSPGIHNEAVRFMEVATRGTALDITQDWRLRTLCVEGASDALVQLANQWLLLDSGGGGEVPAGWKAFGASLRPAWWNYRRHEERGTGKLSGKAREPKWAEASIAAVPGNKEALPWPTTGAAPADEAAWLRGCRDRVLHAAQYAALRSALGLPVEEPQEPPTDPPPPTNPDPPTDPGTPPVPEGLREKLRAARAAAFDAGEGAREAKAEIERGRVAADKAVALLDAALAALEGQ